jgi:hypothetical protein
VVLGLVATVALRRSPDEAAPVTAPRTTAAAATVPTSTLPLGARTDPAPAVDREVEAVATEAARAALGTFTHPAGAPATAAFTADSPSVPELAAIGRALVASGVRIETGPLEVTPTEVGVTGSRATVDLEVQHQGLWLRSEDTLDQWAGPGSVHLRAELQAIDGRWLVVVLRPFGASDDGTRNGAEPAAEPR